MNEQKWWRNPQGIVAVLTIGTLILGFFYVREKQMWEQSSRIEANEKRGATAISDFNERFSTVERSVTDIQNQRANAVTQINTRFERLEQTVNDIRNQLTYLEKKTEYVEHELKNMKEKQGQKYSPQWNNQ